MSFFKTHLSLRQFQKSSNGNLHGGGVKDTGAGHVPAKNVCVFLHMRAREK
jgi:hypothetical protein